MAKKSMIAKPVDIIWDDADKPLKWLFGTAAIRQLAEKYENLGEAFNTMQSISSGGVDNFTTEAIDVFVDILHAGFLAYQPNMTRKEVDDAIDFNNMGYFGVQITNAINKQSPDPVEGADPK